MACPEGILEACDFPQLFVNETPKFDELIMEDVRLVDGWIGNVSTGTTPMSTPTEITQDRFKHVWPNTTKVWSRVNASSCTGNPCDPTEYQIGWGAERLTYYAEQQTWGTPLICYDQQMHVTHAMQHIDQLITDILRPATSAISSNFLRKRALQWAGRRQVASSTLPSFTFEWVTVNTDEEVYLDTNINPNNVYLLVPQMLQNRFAPLMRQGYAGANPFKETLPFIELVTDMDTAWSLDKLGGSVGVGGTPSVSGNWRFTQWSAANEYWRYGFSGQIGNFMVRVDEMGLRFNFVTDLGAGAHSGNGNRYRYQIVLPYTNSVTSGAGGAAGIGSEPNPDYDQAHFAISFIWHKNAMELLTPDARPLNPEMPFIHRDFGGKWKFAMHDLGADADGNAISNKWGNKGQFISWFKYYIRPKQTKYAEVFFHKREQFCIPNVNTYSADPGYPAQAYNSENTPC
jgi:hypothetical protein